MPDLKEQIREQLRRGVPPSAIYKELKSKGLPTEALDEVLKEEKGGPRQLKLLIIIILIAWGSIIVITVLSALIRLWTTSFSDSAQVSEEEIQRMKDDITIRKVMSFMTELVQKIERMEEANLSLPNDSLLLREANNLTLFFSTNTCGKYDEKTSMGYRSVDGEQYRVLAIYKRIYALGKEEKGLCRVRIEAPISNTKLLGDNKFEDRITVKKLSDDAVELIASSSS